MDSRYLLLCAAVLAAAAAIPWDVETPLDTYVHSDDGYFSWEYVTEYRYNSCTVYIVNMTSQKWMDETFVDRPYWWHMMGIAIADEANATTPDGGFLFIGGADNDEDSVPGEDYLFNQVICSAALDTGMVGAYINQMPNQPLVFYNDPTLKSRSEDSLIAWTWRTFYDNPEMDPSVICRFPMTKAAKRGLDTINEVAQMYAPGYITSVDRFAVSGPSKRGWTTWSIAATDQRVFAIAPLVFSMLKVNETLMSHYQSLGGAWSFAFGPYWRENLTQELLEPDAEAMFAYEDMWYYRDRLTLPILQIVSTGDEFFLCQDSHHWWNDIPDPKWTLMLENAEHVMFPHYARIYDTMMGFLISILEDVPLPSVTWERGETVEGGFINFFTDTTPTEIEVFRAVTLRNDTRRDFRLAAGNPDEEGTSFHPVLWTRLNSTLEETGPNSWRATTNKVDDEWVGFVVKAVFSGPNGKNMTLTSETQIIPDTFPAPPCTGPESCYGSLI